MGILFTKYVFFWPVGFVPSSFQAPLASKRMKLNPWPVRPRMSDAGVERSGNSHRKNSDTCSMLVGLWAWQHPFLFEECGVASAQKEPGNLGGGGQARLFSTLCLARGERS